MRKSRFAEMQIVSILKEADAGLAVKQICRKHGIFYATYYKWKSRYGGMEASAPKAFLESMTRAGNGLPCSGGLPFCRFPDWLLAGSTVILCNAP